MKKKGLKTFFYSNFDSSPSIDSSWMELSSLPRLGVESRPAVLKFIVEPPRLMRWKEKERKKSKKAGKLGKIEFY